jgi:hypothetical protein
MRRRLLKNLVQEVPEAYSVCEFDCPKHCCSIRELDQCELRQRVLQQRSPVRPAASRNPGLQPQIKWQPLWIYELIPFVYILAGFACFYYLDSPIGYVAGALLLTAAGLVWVMRFKYRARGMWHPDNSRYPRRPDS